MSLLNMLMQAQGGQGLAQLAEKMGIDPAQATQLTEVLAPAIASGAKKRVAAGGADRVLQSLQGEGQARFLDNPAEAAAPEAREAGENFLAEILGSREATQNLASEAASRAGVGADQVSQFLPALASMVQGGMQRNMPDDAIQGLMSSLSGGGAGGGGIMGMVGSLLGGGSKDGGGGMDMLTNMLDADGDGSIMDDVLDRFIK